jgi:hypothetical protein
MILGSNLCAASNGGTASLLQSTRIVAAVAELYTLGRYDYAAK